VTTEAKSGESDAVEVESAPIEAEPTDDAEEQPTAVDAEPRARGGSTGSLVGELRKRLGAILLVLALLVSAGAAAWLYFFQYLPDQRSNADAAKVAVDAASAGTIAALTYSPESVEKDFAAAKTHLTGDFLNHYTGFTEQIVIPAAKQKAVKTSAAVVQAAASEIHPDSAVVLVFVNQVTTSKENPDGSFAGSAVKIGLEKVDDRWLIATFEPV
jgi:Mce-associated membrane protein